MLLFGEHTVLQGGEAYAVPLRRYGARLDVGSPNPRQTGLLDFGSWLGHLREDAGVAELLDLGLLSSEVDQLRIESSIPIGYGLGSSGALSALLYRRYARHAWVEGTNAGQSLTSLRDTLATLESYFHGTSSGLDPLTSLLDRGVFIGSKGEVELGSRSNPLPHPQSAGGWFLLDSGRARQGELAVRSFRVSAADATWNAAALQPMLATVQQIVESIRGSSFDSLPQNMRRLSTLQLEYLPADLIPDSVRQLWEEWLAGDSAYLKLCGAGAGGFYLGYAPDKEPLRKANVQWISQTST